MTLYAEGVASTDAAELSVRNSKLPPGGGRAAAGSTSSRRRRRETAQSPQPKGTKWVALTRLGGSEPRFRVQLGNQIIYVDGMMSVIDVWQGLRPGGNRGGDET